MEGSNQDFEEWLSTRPQIIRDLAREFPIPDSYVIEGRQMWVMGWNEANLVLLTPICPAHDYEAARAACVHVHAECLRDALRGSR